MAVDTNQEKSIRDEILAMPKFTNSDKSIVTNAVVQVGVAAGMMVLFLIFRRRASWLYYPNVKDRLGHPAYRSRVGLFNWVVPVIKMKDTELLSLIGLDGFMFLQTIKLLYRICLIFGVIVAPWLCLYYFRFKRSTDVSSELFVRMSISGIGGRYAFSVVVLLVYLVSLVIYYLVFIYYKRYVTLRQLYLSSPATMTSIVKLKELANVLNSDRYSTDSVDIATRTVLMDRLPMRICTDEECLEYIISLGVGDVESAVLVKDTYDLQKMYEERDTMLQLIEKEVNGAFLRMKEFYKDNKHECDSSFYGAENADDANDDIEDLALRVYDKMKMTTEEKTKIGNEFFEFEKFLNKTNETTYLKLYVARLKEINEMIVRERECLSSVDRDNTIDMTMNIDTHTHDDTHDDTNDDTHINDTHINDTHDQSLFIRSDLQHDVSFFSLRQIFNCTENKRLFTLDLPIGRKKAFVTFKNQKTTGIIKQAKIGTRVFSCSAQTAPPPHDVIWRNITKNEISNYFAKIISTILFTLFNIIFFYFAILVISMLKIDKNSANYLIRLLQRHKTLSSLYTGFLAPLVYNTLLFFVPIIIASFISIEGIRSYSGFQVRLMYLFSLFLFFNGFLSIFFASSLFSFFTDLLKKDRSLADTLSSAGDSIVESSVFFFNTIVQRLCIGTAMVFLKPGPFIINFIITPFITKTRRQEQEVKFSPPIDFGNAIPNILLIFPMVIVYSCICPVMFVLGFVYYAVNYFAYKNELVFASKNQFESGGIYWKSSAKFILYSLVAFQLATCVRVYASGHTYFSVSIVPLFLFTYLFKNGLDEMFERSCENFPLNSPEEKYLDVFARKVLRQRSDLLLSWNEFEEEEDEDVLPIADLGSNKEKQQSFYSDPSMSTSISKLILPKNFFIIIKFLLTFDSKNVFGFK